MTCDRNKESLAVKEVYRLLEDVSACLVLLICSILILKKIPFKFKRKKQPIWMLN